MDVRTLRETWEDARGVIAGFDGPDALDAGCAPAMRAAIADLERALAAALEGPQDYTSRHRHHAEVNRRYQALMRWWGRCGGKTRHLLLDVRTAIAGYDALSD